MDMDLRNQILGRKWAVCAVVTMTAVCLMTGCGKEKKISYGEEPGVATGTVDFTGDKAEINIENIISPIGADIDYTSMLDLLKGEEDYSVQVNASAVKNDKPGTYNVEYKFTYGDDTYTDNIKVTITDDESVTTGVGNQDQILSNETGATSEINGGNTGNTGESQGGDGQNNSTGQNGGGSEETGGQKEPETTKRELITDPDNQVWQDSDIPNAVIELLSGDVVTISCSTSKYIVATRTDVSEIERNGHHYSVSKLVIIFNTGAEQVLETIEKKID